MESAIANPAEFTPLNGDCPQRKDLDGRKRRPRRWEPGNGGEIMGKGEACQWLSTIIRRPLRADRTRLAAVARLSAIAGYDAPKQTVSVSRNTLAMSVVSGDRLESIREAVESARREIDGRDGAIDVCVSPALDAPTGAVSIASADANSAPLPADGSPAAPLSPSQAPPSPSLPASLPS